MRRFAITLLLCAVAQTTVAAPPSPITKLQARQWPEHVVTRRILDQFAAALYQSPSPGPDTTDRPPPKLPLADLTYWTKSYSSGMAGLCQADIVTFRFHPSARDQGARTPTTVRGVHADPLYRFITPPSQFEPSYLEDTATLRQADAVCAKLNPQDDMLTSGDRAENIWKAAWLVSEIARQAKAGARAYTVDCPTNASDCGKELDGLKAEKMTLVDTCESSEPSYDCLTVSMDSFTTGAGLSLRIHFRERTTGTEIFRVTPSNTILLWHERPD